LSRKPNTKYIKIQSKKFYFINFKFLLLKDFKKTKRKADNYQSQLSESDKIIRELRAREEDMTESVKSKDAQLAILRVRFEEYENDLKAKNVEINSLRIESERILKENSNSSDLQSQVFQTLKEKLNDLETNLQREKEAYSNAQV